MPITPISSRLPDGSTPSSSRRKNMLEFGHASNISSDTSTVREKIRQWQKQGGGVAHAPEVDCTPASAHDDAAVTTTAGEFDREYESKRYTCIEKESMRTPVSTVRDRERTKSSLSSLSSRESQDKFIPLATVTTATTTTTTTTPVLAHGLEFPDDGDFKSSSRPKKRVISDAHWRKDRNVQKQTQQKEIQPRKKNELLDQYVENVPPPLASPRVPFTPYSSGLSSPPGSHIGFPLMKFGAPSGHVTRRGRDLNVDVTEGDMDGERETRTRARRRERARSTVTVRTAYTANLSEVGSEAETKLAPKKEVGRQSQNRGYGHMKSKSWDVSKLQESNNDSEVLQPKPALLETGKMKRRDTSPNLTHWTSRNPNASELEHDKVKDKPSSRKKNQKLFGKDGPPPTQPTSKGSNIEAWLSTMDDPPELGGFDDGYDISQSALDRGMTSSPVHSRKSVHTDRDGEDHIPYARASLKKKETKKMRPSKSNKERARADAERHEPTKTRRRKSPVTDPEPISIGKPRRNATPKSRNDREIRKISRRNASPDPEVEHADHRVDSVSGKPSLDAEIETETRILSRRKTSPIMETEPAIQGLTIRRLSLGAEAELEVHRVTTSPISDEDSASRRRGKSMAPLSRNGSVTPEEKKSVKSRIEALNQFEPAPPIVPWKKALSKPEKEESKVEGTTEEPAQPLASDGQTARNDTTENSHQYGDSPHQKKQVEATTSLELPEEAPALEETPNIGNESCEAHLDEPPPDECSHNFEIRVSSPITELAADKPGSRPVTPSNNETKLSTSIMQSPAHSIPLGSPVGESLTPNGRKPRPSSPYTPEESDDGSRRRAETPIPHEGDRPSSRGGSPVISYIASPPLQKGSPISSPGGRRTNSSVRSGRQSVSPALCPLFAPTEDRAGEETVPQKIPESGEPDRRLLASPLITEQQTEQPERVDSPFSGTSDGGDRTRLSKLHWSLEQALQDTVKEGALLDRAYADKKRGEERGEEEEEEEEQQEPQYQGSILDRPPPLKFNRQGIRAGGAGSNAVRMLAAPKESLNHGTIPPALSTSTPMEAVFETISEGNEMENAQKPPDDILSAGGEGLQRRLTTHRELMSVLSQNGEDRIPSGRSSRRGSKRSRVSNTSITDILRELTADETKYMRELRTLVGGVIPVLLSSVVSESDSATTAGLFRPSANPEDNDNFAKPILAMGDWLKQLKERHKAIPLENVENLLTWADESKIVYQEYLSSWRLGFQDVIINLALPSEDDDPSNRNKDDDVESLYAGGMSQDSDGDVVDGEGIKVDVAFLLKRPLVRLKYLAKTFKGIDATQHSAKSEEVAKAFQALVTEARKRANEERARLEDEAAAAIDATRVRSLKDMTPMREVIVNKDRRVKARDPFGLSLLHTSGQQIDCECELILRDNPPDVPPGGDLLICEVDDLGRWLLFPPIERGRASARKGDARDELVVMIRGVPGEEEEWKELLCFQADDPEIAQEWISMIGLSPVPPAINRSLSFVNRLKDNGNKPPPGTLPTDSLFTVPEECTIISSNLDVPIGEAPGQYPLPGSPHTGSNLSKDEVIRGPTNSFIAFNSLRRSSALRRSRYGSIHRPSLGNRKSSENRRQDPSQRDLRAHSPDSKEGDSLPPPKPDFAQSTGGRSQSPSAKPPTSHKLQNHSPMVVAASGPERAAPSTFDDILTSVTSSSAPTPQGDSKKINNTPILNAASGNAQKRRSPSPLKNEYAPRPSSRTSQSSLSTVDLNGAGTTTESSDEGLESDHVAAPIPRIVNRRESSKPPFAPSNVPDGFSPPVEFVFEQQQPPFKPVRSNAMVYYWDDKGRWESVHSSECVLVITGGLIEAYEISLAPLLDCPDKPSTANNSPLLALELTPLVPIRRGTAVDISVRSPPTARSRMQPGNNIMFRCRTPEECDKLYGYINLSRTNNSTYIAMQNAQQTYPALEPVERQGSRRANKGFFGGLGRSNSYRASSKPPRSTSGVTESSVGTMATAFSAIKKFGRSKVFNLARTTVASTSSTTTNKQGANSGGDSSQYSGISSGSGNNANSETCTLEPGIGLTNAKIRLYTRMVGNKWGDLGAARLTILPAETAANPVGNNENHHAPESRIFASPYFPEGNGPNRAPQPAAGPGLPAKRIVVTSKNGGTLIDACLGESCFERVARTGIAVSVYEDSGVPKEGGVMIGNFKVYMIQMKSEAETAYTFGLVGKLRY
ncbi:hypothetical protein KEM54_005036 [Ascosphaera aggregata]|nr:hypothetical protein KEM54_005036 [Ascosphaera aggregata]